MLISQLYRSNSLNDVGYEILQKWYKLTNAQKHSHIEWLADQLRGEGVDGKTIAVNLADRIGVKISNNFPPPEKSAGGSKSKQKSRR